MSCPSVNVQASMRCGGVKYTYRVSRKIQVVNKVFRKYAWCPKIYYTCCPEVMQCVQKLCNVSINYAVCPEVMQCVQKLCSVSISYTGCSESIQGVQRVYII